ncbi:MAG: papain-like cysteine protease family protein, partial [Gemmatimonadota bacterium]
MQNRIASLFALDELLSGKSNGRNGHGATKRPRRKRRRTAHNANVAARKIADPHAAFHHRHQKKKTHAQSFDTGGPIRCEHNVAYTPAEQIRVPASGEQAPPGGAAMSFDVGDGYTVEAFEDEDEEESLSALPHHATEISEVDTYGSEAVRASSYEPYVSETPSARGDYERRPPASFAAQMSAVERDLADLATRVQQPGAEPNAAAPAAEDEQGAESQPAPVSTSGHRIFDSMAKGMSYATEFRLPAVQLSQVFSALDKELDAENAAPSTPAPTVVSGPTPVGVESIPPNDVLIKDLVDLPPKTAHPPVSAVAAAAIDVRHEVQLVPQLTGFSCWAAGAAMLVGWREQMSIDPSEIARATGYWAQYAAGL